MAREQHSMSLHDRTAAMFEAQGRAAYPAGRNPHNPGTMANERWAAGWHQADTIEIERPARFDLLDCEGGKWMVTDCTKAPGRALPARAFWVQRMQGACSTTVQAGIVGMYQPSLERVHAVLNRAPANLKA
ncbi:MAG: hypothetical protein ABW128_07045 [Rhizorhabdus sp.]